MSTIEVWEEGSRKYTIVTEPFFYYDRSAIDKWNGDWFEYRVMLATLMFKTEYERHSDKDDSMHLQLTCIQ